MGDKGSDGLDALARAAEQAITYRKAVATAERTPVAGYADILTAFAGPTPERGGDRPRSSTS